MKKFLSTILAVVMVLSSMAMVVSADDSLADGIYVGTTKYETFTAAQTAAAANTNKEIIISGTVEFGSRQGISVDGIHLRGINNAKIIPSTSYGSTDSTTNWKGLLNIAGEGVTVSDIVFDGSRYGDNQAITVDFKPVRVTSGTTTLNNVTIKGSKRTLLMVGTSSSSAIVNANGLTIEADEKTLSTGKAYADVEVVGSESELNVSSGSIDGYILGPTDSLDVAINGYYVFSNSDDDEEICTTAETLANGYVNNVSSITNTQVYTYSNMLCDSADTTAIMISDIVNDIENKSDIATTFVDMIDDMLGRQYTIFGATIQIVSGSDRTALTGHKDALVAALATIE